jgi:hypothetical protein
MNDELSAQKSFDFGITKIGTTKNFQWKLENKSDKPALLDPLPNFNAASLKISNPLACSRINPHSDCILEVLFNPTSHGKDLSETFKISYKIDGKAQELFLKLEGKTKESLDKNILRALDLNFASVRVGDAQELPVALDNTNNIFAVKDIQFDLVSAAKFFTIDDINNCSQGIASGSQCIIHVKFAPTAPRAYQEEIKISYITNNIKKYLDIKIIAKAHQIGAAGDKKDQLFDILHNRPIEFYLNPQWHTPINYGGHIFGVDKDGQLYIRSGGSNFNLNVTSSPSGPGQYFMITHPPIKAGLGAGPYNISFGNQDEKNKFSFLVQRQRAYGIFSLKNTYSDCYFAYAQKRLNMPNPATKLLNMERDHDPIPLVFHDQAQWDDFKKDIKNLFKHVQGPDAYVAIIGTATTFFSVNPTKGKNSAFLKAKPPTCLNENNPDIYTFDTPGADASDIDINILIPAISRLCRKVEKNYPGQALGNMGDRVAYWENTLNECLWHQDASKKLQDMFTPTNPGRFEKINGHLKHGSDFYNFYKKWHALLKDRTGKPREINFSVRILPSDLRAPLTASDSHFNNDPLIQSGRFVIPIDGK